MATISSDDEVIVTDRHMPEIKPPLGLRPKFIAYSERLKEIHEAIGRYLDAGKAIPQEWIDEFSMLNSLMQF